MLDCFECDFSEFLGLPIIAVALFVNYFAV
jgi:hypothetical protein